MAGTMEEEWKPYEDAVAHAKRLRKRWWNLERHLTVWGGLCGQKDYDAEERAGERYEAAAGKAEELGKALGVRDPLAAVMAECLPRPY